MSIKYPYDAYVRQTSQKTFTIEDHLSVKGNDEDSPLEVFSRFARFVVTILKDKKATKFNIAPSEIPGLYQRTNIAANMQVQFDSQPTAGGGVDTSGPAFTERFRTGTLSGKTPVEVLLENPGQKGKDILNSQYKWLKENLAKFRGNQKLMDAIVEASKVDLSKIESATVTAPKPVTILEIGTRPLIRNKREDGKSFCYEGKVTWDFTRKYPVTVTISNYYAPVTVKEGGTLNVQLSQKADVVTVDYSLTASDWMDAAEMLMCNTRSFKEEHLPECRRKAEAAAKAARDAASKA